MLLGSAPASAQEMEAHGGEKIVRVKRKAQSFFAPGKDATWSVEVSGPARVAIGFRLVSRSGRGPAVITAELDGTYRSELRVRTTREGAARLAGERRAKVSREVVVQFEVPAGSHEMRLRVQGKRSRALARLLPTAPAGAIAAPSFPVPPPVAPVEPPPSEEAAVAAAPPSSTAKGEAVGSEQEESAAQPAAEAGDGAASTHEIIAVFAGEEAPAGAASATATAATEPAAEPPPSVGITLGIGAGVAFPQLLTELSTGVVGVIEAGFRLPVLQQRIELSVTGSYNQATRRSSATDDRLAAAQSYDFLLEERQVVVSAGLLARLYPPGSGINVYGRLAARLELQRSQVQGDVDSLGFGENVETRTSGGVVVGAGGEYHLGPGAVALELTFALADLSHRVTGNTSDGGLGLRLGYRLMF